MFQNQEIKLDGLTIIVGLNNFGKTIISDEIINNGNGAIYDFSTFIYSKEKVFVLDGVDRKCDPRNTIKLAEKLCDKVTAGIKFVVTTFNPDFLKALNYYSKKYEIENVTNYYQTENINDKIIITDKTKRLHELFDLLTSDISEMFFKSVQLELQKIKKDNDNE